MIRVATQTIYTNKDTYANKFNPTTVFGSTNDILIDKEDIYNLGSIGYVGFNITTAPTSVTVTNVTYYYYRPYYSGTPTGYFRRVTSTWAENTLTWNLQPTVTDINMTTTTFIDSLNWGSVNVTNIYKDAKNAGNEFSIQIKQSTEIAIALSSRETVYDSYIIITTQDYYVKTTGNDSLDGLSWINAWKTINKAATTVLDGFMVHIGFGTYDAEPASNKIAPQNIGSLGISYLPETAETGGGTGTVSIEQNA